MRAHWPHNLIKQAKNWKDRDAVREFGEVRCRILVGQLAEGSKFENRLKTERHEPFSSPSQRQVFWDGSTFKHSSVG